MHSRLMTSQGHMNRTESKTMAFRVVGGSVLLLVLLQESSCASNFSLIIGQHQRQTIEPLQNYTIVVNTSATSYMYQEYSAFTIQVHSQMYNLTLWNASSQCNVSRLCSTSGTDVGLVQLMLSNRGQYWFEVSIRSCGGANSSCAGVANVSILIAAVGVHSINPIPGGCAQTSALDYEAALTSHYDNQSTTVYFQDSDVALQPTNRTVIPACDSAARLMQRLEYHVFRQCLSPGNFDEDSLFKVIEAMLEPTSVNQPYVTLKYSDPKRVFFDSFGGRGIVYNVLVRDTTSGMTSPYIPASTYSCDFFSGGCERTILMSSYILGPLLGLAGLFLCFLGHRFFHLEVFIFPILIGYFLFYLTLSATTQWSYDTRAGSSLGLAVVFSLLLFVLWFFTGWYYIFVIFFGFAMGSLVSATLLFTPLGSIISFLELNYIYILGFLCVAVICIVPLVAFPVILNIVASSMIGSYSIVFCISMFKYNQLQEILVRVVKNASIPGFLNAGSGCTFDTIDIICSCLWILLAIAGVAVQLILYLIQKRRYKKKQLRSLREPYVIGDRFRRYTGFPIHSLYCQLKNRWKNKRYYVPVARVHHRANDSSRPLLSPNSTLNAHGSTYGSNYVNT